MRYAACAMGVLALAGAAEASLLGSADLTPQDLGGGLTHYTGVLHNSGDTTIGTLWYAWLAAPLEDFLPHVPTNISSPPGWFANVQGGGVGNGYSIEWYTLNPGSYVAPGGNLGGFGFDSLDSPAVMTGPAPTDSRYVVSTSFLYIGFPQADPGLRITANIVPGPSVLGLLGIAGIGAARRKRRA